MPASDNTRRFLDDLDLGPEVAARIGDLYQQITKYDPRDMRVGGPRPQHPGVYKRYPDAIKTVSLPQPECTGGEGLWQVVARRRSERQYLREAMTLADVSQLLWASQGITERTGGGHELRTAPSAGALYPIETYLVVNRVEGVGPGVYHYSIRRHQIECLREGDLGRAAAQTALGQEMVASSGVVFVWTSVTARCKSKYGERGYRYMYLDAGHIGAHVSLAAEALGLGTCAIGALFDDEVNDLLGVDGVEETVVYMTSVGRK